MTEIPVYALENKNCLFLCRKQLLSVFVSGEHQLLAIGKNTKLYSYLLKVGDYFFVCLNQSHVQKYGIPLCSDIKNTNPKVFLLTCQMPDVIPHTKKKKVRLLSYYVELYFLFSSFKIQP